jgi:hypothetical protein
LAELKAEFPQNMLFAWELERLGINATQ